MLSRRVVLFGFLLLSMASCKKSADRPDTYFDSLIVAQIRNLSRTHPDLNKTVWVNGKEAHVSFHPDSMIWKDELDVYRQLTLFERSSYKNAYHIEDGLSDNKSNLRIRQYTATRKIPVPELKFYYYQKLKNLKKIEAIYQQSNALYTTRRHLILEFEDIKGAPVLVSYTVDGAEKMILSDSMKFAVHARITYPF